MIYKPVSINLPGCCKCSWFQPVIIPSGTENYIKILPGVIYRSFNLKDMMIWTGYLDDATKNDLTSLEGTISGHVIHNLMKNLGPVKEDDIVFLEIGISPSLYATGAQIKIASLKDGNAPWSGYPEPFIFSSPLIVDNNGIPTINFGYRRQTAAIVPIAYFTNDFRQKGTIVQFGTEESSPRQVMVRTLCNNLQMQTFHYDGFAVTYPTQATLHPFFYYSSSSSSS